MKRVLVVGDLIQDFYHFGASTRLCPEAPVPVITDVQLKMSMGGAGLVLAQLRELGVSVEGIFGSLSYKHRYFANDRMVCRIDEDRQPFEEKHEFDWSLDLPENFEKDIQTALKRADVLVVSDYNKGAIPDDPSAKRIMSYARIRNVPVFVDAKNNWSWYDGAYAFFPNEHEYLGAGLSYSKHVIRKLGGKGSMVDGETVPLEPTHDPTDVTGAGDIFLAAFVDRLMYYENGTINHSERAKLLASAGQANRVAHESTRHIGTHIVSKDF